MQGDFLSKKKIKNPASGKQQLTAGCCQGYARACVRSASSQRRLQEQHRWPGLKDTARASPGPRGEARPPPLPANVQSHVRPQRRGEERCLSLQTAYRKAAPAPAGLSGEDETCKLAFKGAKPQHARRNLACPELPAGFSPGLLCRGLGQQRPAAGTRLQSDLGLQLDYSQHSKF